MAVTTVPNTLLLMDDELFNIQWLMDYLVAKGYEVLPTSSADEAVIALSEEIYRAAILDLNVPMSSAPDVGPIKRKSVYKKYPGLYVAWHARNRGYRNRQVIIYSVHRDPEVAQEAEILGCTYILKGRPAELKREIEYVLSFDPTLDFD